MSKIFLSHSSKDKTIIRDIATKLKELGYEVWLDEWEIKVGDCIISKVEKGLNDCQFLILALSKESVRSGWVDKEWKTKYWDEVNSCEIKVLPILLEDTDLPVLIKTKKYADFRESVTKGIIELNNALNPLIIKSPVFPMKQSEVPRQSIVDMITKLNKGEEKLSVLLTEGITLASELKNTNLEQFCLQELEGYENNKSLDDNLKHRAVMAYMTVGEINMNYWGFSNNQDYIFTYISNDKDNFNPFMMILPDSVTFFEENSKHESAAVLRIKIPLKQFDPDSKQPEYMTNVYLRPDSYKEILKNIRTEFLKILISLLPRNQMYSNS